MFQRIKTVSYAKSTRYYSFGLCKNFFKPDQKKGQQMIDKVMVLSYESPEPRTKSIIGRLEYLLSVPEDPSALKVVLLGSITKMARQLNLLGLGVMRV